MTPPRILVSRTSWSTLALLTFAVGCSPSFVDKANEDDGTTDGSTSDGEDGSGEVDGEADGTDEELEDLEQWEGATLAILSPAPSAFLPYGETAEFTAEVLDADGNPLEFDEVTWVSNVGDWSKTGLEFESDSLDVGTHTLTVEANLPDGTRLSNQVGGIRVQGERSGTWVGNLQVDVAFDYQGTPLNATCVGTTFLEVGPEAETAEGESTCYLSAVIFNTDLTHVFSLTFDDDDVYGEAAIDLFGIQLAFDAEGAVDGRDLEVTWAGELLGYADLVGTLTLEQVSRDIGGLD